MSLRSVLDRVNYDPETGEFTDKIGGHKVGYVSTKGPIMVYGEYAHRLAVLAMTGKEPEADVDHRDMNCQNNKWSNLREATRSQNRCNTPVRKDNKLGIKGVHRRGDRYVAQIQINGKKKCLGTYDTPEEASEVYQRAAAELHGEFHHVV